ncbi:UTRA domain-containing protein [Wohlfahrtiimonas populi]|uniref:UTRA domain-containing protein n=1 Tax=Wohlfahrtiimonas populi TaxID=1940240 RepID=UPI00098D2D4D|nr:UTRA domain-containing protein [Wohlfahrtiimonas populi]
MQKVTMAIPKYKNIKNYILSGITSGLFKQGGQIPTELELSAMFEVSRMTVNRAITDLTAQNVLTRIPGKGTFVTAEKAAASATNVTDIALEVTKRGNKHSIKVLVQDVVSADENVALGLGIFTGSSVHFCHLVHYENGQPLIIEKRYVNPIFVPNFIEQDFLKTTPSGYLLEKHGLSRMEQTIEAVAATEIHADLLEIPAGEPCLYITRRTWDRNNIISVAQFLAPGMRYKYFVSTDFSS